MSVLYIDVSHYDRDRRGAALDWDAIAASGLGGVMVARATYGDPQVFAPATRYFGEHTEGARAAGYIMRGGYHNLIRGDQASINRQVDWLRAELDAHGCNWGMADVEPYDELRVRGLWPRWEDVQRFHDRWYAVESRTCAWYIARWVWSGWLGSPDLMGLRGPLINANYPATTGTAQQRYAAAGGDSGPGWAAYGGRTPGIWQFTSQAAVPGASNLTDVNAHRGTLPQLITLLGGGMTLPEHAITWPAVLAGKSNGQLPDSILFDTPGQAAGAVIRLVWPATRAWRALQDAAREAGHILKAGWATSSYRSLAQQQSTFDTRYTTTPLAGQPTRTCKGVTYWLKPGYAVAACPGTSNHGWGLAVDVGEERDGDTGTESIDAVTLAWLVANEFRFGFSHEVQSEPWHIRYWAGDVIPAAVLQFEEELVGLSDRDAQFLIWRVEAILNNRPTVGGGPGAGETNDLQIAIAALQRDGDDLAVALKAMEAREVARDAAIEAREVARDAAQTTLINQLLALGAGSPLTAEQLAALVAAVRAAVDAASAASRDAVLAVLARQEREHEAGLRDQLAAETPG